MDENNSFKIHTQTKELFSSIFFLFDLKSPVNF